MSYTGRKPSSAPLTITSAGIENGTIEEVDLNAALSGKINDKYTQAETDAKIVELAPTPDLSGLVDLTTAQSVGGVKTFTSFPVTPSAAPTTNYQVANRKFVLDNDLGVGQTWQNVTASRSVGVTYTNTTGKPIQIAVHGALNVNGAFEILINGTAVASSPSAFTNGARIALSPVIIPNGSNYSVTYAGNTGTVTLWDELR